MAPSRTRTRSSSSFRKSGFLIMDEVDAPGEARLNAYLVDIVKIVLKDAETIEETNEDQISEKTKVVAIASLS